MEWVSARGCTGGVDMVLEEMRSIEFVNKSKSKVKLFYDRYGLVLM